MQIGKSKFQNIFLLFKKKGTMWLARTHKMNDKLIKVVTERNDSRWRNEAEEILKSYNIQYESKGEKIDT